jgi:hypothetical protein
MGFVVGGQLAVAAFWVFRIVSRRLMEQAERLGAEKFNATELLSTTSRV